MNTGYQLSYSTPKGAKSSTSHIGKEQYGKTFFHKDMPMIMAAANLPYAATAAESNPADLSKSGKGQGVCVPFRHSIYKDTVRLSSELGR